MQLGNSPRHVLLNGSHRQIEPVGLHGSCDQCASPGRQRDLGMDTPWILGLTVTGRAIYNDKTSLSVRF